ncbi:MAG: hypothetical protein ACKOAS_09405 [Verrucomicrobiota bacterium]
MSEQGIKIVFQQSKSLGQIAVQEFFINGFSNPKTGNERSG